MNVHGWLALAAILSALMNAIVGLGQWRKDGHFSWPVGAWAFIVVMMAVIAYQNLNP